MDKGMRQSVRVKTIDGKIAGMIHVIVSKSFYVFIFGEELHPIKSEMHMYRNLF